MQTDKWGNPLSCSSARAAAALGRAIESFAAYRSDALAVVDDVVAEHPDLVIAHALRAGMLATATDKAFEADIRKSVAAAEALLATANERERGHVAACRAWLDGDFERGLELWGRVAIAWPRDLLAIQLAHLGDFIHGYSHMLRDRVARILPHWHKGVPGYGYVLGMYAFGLEESGDYGQAERTGLESVDLNPADGWGAHAVAHVYEMQGRTSDGVHFLERTRDGWAPGNGFAYHNFWHLALFHLDSENPAAALALFDGEISSGGFGQALELVDGCALLWRMMLLGHDVGARWNVLADKWAERLDDRYYVFNDLHAMMAFIGAGRRDSQKSLIAAVERAAAGSGTNAMMTREVGFPAVRGFEAFGRGAYRDALDLLMPLRAKASRFGGSHAQRDIFSWTLTEAAVRCSDAALANALAAERLSWKPESPLNRAWTQRARELAQAEAA